jgi:perosamine synthetase
MIPVNEPSLAEKEMEYAAECLRTGWISSAGEFLERFEHAWAEYCGMRHGVAVTSGTAGLQLAVACLDLQPGDEVILPTFTIISCALAVLYAGGRPVLVDADPETWCMDVGQVEGRLTERTRAILPVHTYGHPVDMDPIRELAAARGLKVIEDAAEAHGAEYLSGRPTQAADWVRCGGMGDLSVFSFYANKPVTTGEGGMLLTNHDQLAARAASLRNLCFDSDRRFRHRQLGFNFRLTNLQAAIGLAQVERIDAIVERKRAIGRAYNERLQGIPGLRLPPEKPWARSIYWMYGVVLEEAVGFDAEEFGRRLGERGVQTRPFFLGMHQQPALQARGLFGGEAYPVADFLSRQGLYLPSGLALTEAQIDQVCEAVESILR